MAVFPEPCSASKPYPISACCQGVLTCLICISMSVCYKLGKSGLAASSWHTNNIVARYRWRWVESNIIE